MKTSRNELANKPCMQYTKEGVFVKLWRSRTDAAKVMGVSPKAISQNIKGRSMSSAGFVWKDIKTE